MAKTSENIIEQQEQTEDIEAQEFVKKEFALLGVEIEKDRTLFTRLVELQKMGHFGDAVEMTKIIDILPVKNKERLKLCALLHDIGKIGPLNVTPEEQQVFNFIYHYERFKNYNYYHFVPVKKVLEKGTQEGFSIDQIKRVEKYLVESLGIDIERTPMIDLWHDHADCTYEILKNANLPQIDEGIVKIAASHHIIDGRNPANLPLGRILGDLETSEIINQCQILTLVDKYQAYRRRSGCSHGETIKALKQIIKAKKEIPENIRDQYLDMIEPFNHHKDELNEIFRRHT